MSAAEALAVERAGAARHTAAMVPAQVPDLSARQLLAVLTVAEQGSFVAAAAVLRTSQPALTRTIRRVEDVLGAALFERTTRRVRLTGPGREFVAVAERLLGALRIAAQSMRESEAASRGRVVLACVMSAAVGPLPAILAAWSVARPGAEVWLREGVHGAVLAELRGGTADLGIGYVDDLPAELAAVPLGRERFVVAAPPDHPLAAREGGVALGELAGERLVSFPPDSRTRRLVDTAAAEAGLALRHALTATQFGTILRLVRAGAGLAIVPQGAVGVAGAEGVSVVPLAPPGLSRRIGLITQTGRDLSPAAAGLLAALRDGWPVGSTDA